MAAAAATSLATLGLYVAPASADVATNASINDVSVTEGTGGTVNLNFTVTLDQAPDIGQTVTVDYATQDGSAVQPSDYVSNTGTLTFVPGDATETVTVVVNSDNNDEVDETFNVVLSNLLNANGGTITDDTGIGTITDDDAAPNLTINDVGVAEGNAGTTNLNFTASLSVASGKTVTVSAASIAGGTATAGTDYTALAPTTVTFNPGQTTKTVTVLVNGDTANEPNETLQVRLSSPTNVSAILKNTGIGTITNDDAIPSLSVNDPNVGEGNSGTATLLYDVTLSAASGQTVTVDYATSNGSATSPGDYTPTSGTLTFNPGQTTKQVSVTVNGDTLPEANETVTLTLSNPSATATIADATGLGTINNDDPTPSLSVDNQTVTEGTGGTTTATYTVTLSAVSGQTITVDYDADDITALAGSDYTDVHGTLTFNPGDLTKTIDVSINPDSLDEDDEQFSIHLTNASSGATIGGPNGSGTITDDDATTATLSANAPSVAEGDAGSTTLTFVVTLNQASGRNVTVNYTTTDVTAAGGFDYTTASGQLTFAPGVTTQNVNVTVAGDTFDEENETLTLNLSGATNAGIFAPTSTGTILDDDLTTATVSVDDVAVTEGNGGGTTNLVFTVSISAPTGRLASVDYTTSNGSATSPADFASTSGTATIGVFQNNTTVTVPVVADALDEVNETFNITLSNPSAGVASIADANGVGTINDDDATPTLSVNDPSVQEGNNGTTNLDYTVTLSAPSGQTVTVNYATSDGTALQPYDYTSTSGTATFAPGVTTQTVSVPVVGETSDEPDEDLVLTLSGPTNATIADATGTGTITDDDPLVELSVTPASGTEASPVVLNVNLAGDSGQTVTVNYATSNGTAVAGTDYTSTSGTLTFIPGDVQQQISVPTSGDVLDENDETFTVTLSGATNAVIAGPTATGTIVDDDAATATASINDVSIAEGNSGSANLAFTVTLTAPTGRDVTVDYATSDGSATQPSDYTTTTGTATIAAGSTTATINVPVIGDTVDEANETFVVTLTNPSAGIASITDASGTGTINDDDLGPAVSVSDATVTEGNSGTVNLAYTVTLAAASQQTVTVDYATSNGSANAVAGDYVAGSGTVTFNPGVTSQTVNVVVNGDTTFEPDETVILTLANPNNTTLGDDTGLGTITNDDVAPTITVNSPSVGEGNAGGVTLGYVVTLSNASTQTVTVDYQTANGTATQPGDYTSTSGTLTFLPGVTSQPVNVNVNGDTLDEANETVLLNLSNGSNGTIGTTSATGTITDDDAATATLSVGDTTVTEGDSGTANATVTVTLTAPTGVAVTADYTTMDGSAMQPGDYAVTTGTVTIPIGQTTGTISVPVVGDTVDEAAENFSVVISNPMNAASITDDTGVVTITDNDNAPTVSVDNQSVAEGNSGTTNLVFNVSLDVASEQTVTVDYATGNATATQPGDYTSTTGTLTFNPGQTTKTVTVPVVGDTTDEVDETFNLTLSNGSNVNLGTNGVGTITDDDAAPDLSVDSPSLAEGNSGTSNLDFTVTLSQASGKTVVVNYMTTDGTATQPGDYTATSGSLTFTPGVTTQTVSVPVVGDTLDEPNENLSLVLVGPSNATAVDPDGLGTITDDDAASVTASVDDVTVTEGNTGTTNAVFTVTLSGASGLATSVDYTTSNGSAVQPGDYTTTSGTLNIAPGVTTGTITVPVVGDVVDEANETYTVTLSNPSATIASISDATGLGTITDDDAGPVASINSPSVVEGNSGTATLNYTVTLNAASEQTVNVNYATSNGTATQPGDYASTSGTLTFTPGQTTKTVPVTVVGDTVDEANETVLVTITTPVNATIGTGNVGTGTITNDDDPTVSVADAVNVTEPANGAASPTLTYNVSVSNPSNVDVTVVASTNPQTSTALAGVDYTAKSQTLTIPAGSVANVPFTVSVLADDFAEENETVVVTLTNPTQSTLGDATGVGTIVDEAADHTPTPTAPDSVQVPADPGDTVSTPDPVSAADPVAVDVTTPVGGVVTIAEQNTTGFSANGYTSLPLQVAIDAPPASAGSPLTLKFKLSESLLTSGGRNLQKALNRLTIFQGGVPVARCTGAGATPDPCMLSTFDVSGGVITLTVRASSSTVANLQPASQALDVDNGLWNFGLQTVDGLEGGGYWLAGADGGIFNYGSADQLGSMAGQHLNSPIVAVAGTPGGDGYWMVAADGGVFDFGSAHNYGAMGDKHLNSPIVGMAAAPDGAGYWLVAADGGIFSFGSAHFYESMGGKHLNSPIVGMKAAPDGAGYWLVAADGGVFSFGSAQSHGSAATQHLNAPVVGIAG